MSSEEDGVVYLLVPQKKKYGSVIQRLSPVPIVVALVGEAPLRTEAPTRRRL
jgi:hypothetical protein